MGKITNVLLSIIKLVLFILLLPVVVFGANESDSLPPSAEVYNGVPGWAQNGIPANDILPPIHDEDTTTYIFSSSGFQCRFSMADPVDMGGNPADSIVVHTIAEVDNDAGNDRIRIRLMNTAQAEYCDGANRPLNGGFIDYTTTFTATAKSGDAGTCTGAMGEVQMDSLVIGILDILGDENRVAEMWVVVWWTSAVAGQVIRIQLGSVWPDVLPENARMEEDGGVTYKMPKLSRGKLWLWDT